jgi:hypothetical protein
MRLQLDSSLTGPSRTGESGQTAPAGGSASASRIGSGGAGAQDSISLSGVSGVLNRASTDRAGRLQQLTALVQSGEYRVSSASVSGAIVEQGLS